ncbi:hypothetical protein ACWEOO_04405 [Kribbella sp. NPDC004138]
MRSELEVGYDPKSSWWIIEPLSALNVGLDDAELVHVALKSTDTRFGCALIDLSIPSADEILRIYFETSSAVLKTEELGEEIPVDVYGQIEGTDFAEPDWYLLQALRCDLEMYSQRQFYEWIRREDHRRE